MSKLYAGVGESNAKDSATAGAEAVHNAQFQLGSVAPKLAIVFASSYFDQDAVVTSVRSQVPHALLIGSSTSGEITSNGPTKNSSVAVMLIGGDDLLVEGGIGEGVSENAKRAGNRAAKQVYKQFPENALKLFMMLPDVLVGNGAEIVRGVQEVLGDHFPIVGGASGDDFHFKKTYQYLNDTVYSGTVAGVGLGGNFSFGVGVKHGWIPIGIPRRVTRSQGSVLHELDGKPAIGIYQEYFGDEEAENLKSTTLARLAITYPLGMRKTNGEEYLIRDPLTVDEHGSITCAAEVPEGSEVQLMIGSREEAIEMAERAAKDALAQLEGEPRAVVIFNCIARQKLFGEHAKDEISRIQSVIGREVPLIGFYTYGEQAPVDGEVRNIAKCNPQFHNETVVILVLGDKGHKSYHH